MLVFHSLCVHRGRDNRTPDQVRLSVDCRYQGITRPVTEGSLKPHFQRLTWEEIYRDWRSTELQYYWTRQPLEVAGFTRRYHDAARPRVG